MATRHSYAPGTPCWVDVSTHDTAATIAFYAELFGWEARPDQRPEAGDSGMFALDGALAAGYAPTATADELPRWTVSMCVADAEATMARIVAHGGTPLVEPVDVFDSGRFALAQDVAGSVVGLWQPATHTGSQVVNDVGAFSWNELGTSDLSHARHFYGDVFAWEEQEPLTDTAAIFTVDGQVVCGAHTAAGDGEQSGWTVWFGVAGCEAAAARVVELGGRVLSPPSDMGFGTGAVVADPQGAVFGITGLTSADQNLMPSPVLG
ncbi:MAG: VOC family protein [Ilumatobacteraceae bacterium]